MRDNVKGGAMTETTFLILLALYSPNHGYGIMQFIEQETGGRVRLGAGTLYGALETFQKRGWIIPLEEPADGRKKKYVITELGKGSARLEMNRVNEIQALASKIVGGEQS